jgi:uncharacterized protein YkwD
LAVTAAFLAAAAFASPALACDNATASAVRAESAQLEHAVLCLVNAERSERGLRALRSSTRLERAAAGHARDMVERDYFSHVSLGGRDVLGRVRAQGYARGGGWRIGENIAWGTGRYATPRHIVRMWMGSPGHRRLILENSFDEAGVGMALGAPRRRTRNAGTYVLDFGRD